MPHTKQSDWAEQMLRMFVPQEYLNDFEINYVEESPEEWVIELIENIKKGRRITFTTKYI